MSDHLFFVPATFCALVQGVAAGMLRFLSGIAEAGVDLSQGACCTALCMPNLAALWVDL
jgi:hypothetical protein